MLAIHGKLRRIKMTEHQPQLTELEQLRLRRERFTACLERVSILPVEIVDNVYYVNFEPLEPEDLVA
jgi:hypothetical protein